MPENKSDNIKTPFQLSSDDGVIFSDQVTRLGEEKPNDKGDLWTRVHTAENPTGMWFRAPRAVLSQIFEEHGYGAPIKADDLEERSAEYQKQNPPKPAA